MAVIINSYVHEVSGPPRDLTEPTQGIRCLGHAQVPGHPGGIFCRSQVPPPPPQIMGEALDGGVGGGVLSSTLPL